MSEVVLDASAFLAYLHEEPGADLVEESLGQGAYMGAVNWAEVLSKIAENRGDPKTVAEELKTVGILDQTLEVLPLLQEDSMIIASLRPSTKALGLSLGDRACLALALRLRLPVLTSDRQWNKLSLNTEIRIVR